MTATANLLGYTGKVNILEETSTGYEIELLQGELKGKRTFISKNSQNETLTFPKKKFTSRIEYSIGKELNEDTNTNQVYARNFDLTITAQTLELAESIWEDCVDYLTENVNFDFSIVGCPNTDKTLKGNKYEYNDSILIEDREEYEILKNLYTKWKRGKM